MAGGTVTGPNQRFGGDPVADVHVTAAPDRAMREAGVAFPGLRSPPIPTWDGNPEVFELDPDALGLPDRSLRFEIQVETPQSILGPDGTALVARMVHASDGRCTGLHYGTYDYSAYCGIAAAQQSLEHPVADHAKAVMQAAAAGTGVRLSDGSTTVLPVGSRDDVRSAWATHLRLVRRSLERGYYQGWDLHAAQLPTRYLATYAFYREGFAAAAKRLDNYLHGSDATIMDEPATARALARFVVRGLECGALTAEEVRSTTGSAPVELARLAHPKLVITEDAS